MHTREVTGHWDAPLDSAVFPNLPKEWRSEYLCTFWDDDPTERRLKELARGYHERTEVYDQQVCSGRDEHGFAKPMNACESMLCTRHAWQVTRELREMCWQERLREPDLQDAIQKEVRLFERDWKAGHYKHLAREPRAEPLTRTAVWLNPDLLP